MQVIVNIWSLFLRHCNVLTLEGGSSIFSCVVVWRHFFFLPTILVRYLSSVCFSSVTACFLPLEWVAWLKMRPRCQLARQKFPLSLSNKHFTGIFTDVPFMLNGFFQIAPQFHHLLCSERTLISKYLNMYIIQLYIFFSYLRLGLNLSDLGPKIFDFVCVEIC